jgi:5-(aminomethyl)-3-furanmethanol phosphate kinase
MCVDLLTVTAHLLHARLPEIPLVEDDRLLCQRVGERGCTVFGPARWMRDGEPQLPGTRLPTNWDVTSDSIAARLAVALRADELVLLKAALPRAGARNDISELSRSGFVDAMFDRLRGEFPAVRIVNMRADSHEEATIRTLGA